MQLGNTNKTKNNHHENRTRISILEIYGIQISGLFSAIHISKWLGFRIQISNGWDSGFKLSLPGPS